MPGAGLGLFRREARKEAPARRPMPLPVFALIAALSTTGAFLLAGGHVLFRTQPAPIAEAASAATSLVLTDVTTRIDTSDRRPVMVVRATVRNQDRTGRVVPPVTISLQRPGLAGTMIREIARGEWLAPGEAIAFTSRFPAGEYAGAEPSLAFRHDP